MFCNTASLYPVVTFARGVTDGRTLVARLMEALQLNGKNKLLKSQYDRRIAGEGAEVQWAPIPGRSLLGGMNELISASKYALADGDLTLEAMSP